jgi:hypothetical protein
METPLPQRCDGVMVVTSPTKEHLMPSEEVTSMIIKQYQSLVTEMARTVIDGIGAYQDTREPTILEALKLGATHTLEMAEMINQLLAEDGN